MRNVLMLLSALVITAAAVAVATGNEHEVGGPPAKGHKIPFWSEKPAMRFQCMWLQSEIGEKGRVVKIEFSFKQYVGTPPSTFTGCKIRLCHTTVNKIAANFKSNYGGKSPVEVFSGKFVVPAGLKENDWVMVVAPKAFTFNNTNNLLMEVVWTGASGAAEDRFWIADADQPGRVRAFSATAVTGTVLANQGQVARITIGSPAVEPNSLGRVRALFR
ncbi:MAG: hypothetical protein GTN49_11335 [candidate division Zixibacteria bacterium]|nr:hypothetical protein [candidate division Zixibacteria bacterium]